MFDGLTKAVERAFVSERQMVGLALEPNLDRIERIFDVFTDNASNLCSASDRGGGVGKYRRDHIPIHRIYLQQPLAAHACP